jgi:beta-glucosidase
MGDSIKIEVSLRNTGKRFGEEVVQLYLRDHHASLIRPIKELKGFQKIGLEPGETTTVRFELSTKELGFYNVDGEWIVEAGAFTVMVGNRSDELQEVRISLE